MAEARTLAVVHWYRGGGGRGVPGVVAAGWYRRVLYRVLRPSRQIEAYLMNYKV